MLLYFPGRYVVPKKLWKVFQKPKHFSNMYCRSPAVREKSVKLLVITAGVLFSPTILSIYHFSSFLSEEPIHYYSHPQIRRCNEAEGSHSLTLGRSKQLTSENYSEFFTIAYSTLSQSYNRSLVENRQNYVGW